MDGQTLQNIQWTDNVGQWTDHFENLYLFVTQIFLNKQKKVWTSPFRTCFLRYADKSWNSHICGIRSAKWLYIPGTSQATEILGNYILADSALWFSD